MQPPGSVRYDSDERHWSLRRGLLYATVRGAHKDVLSLQYGSAALRNLAIYDALLGGALFASREMIARGNWVRLTSFAPSNDPTATPTDIEDPRQSIFHLRELTDGLELRYRSLTGLPMGSVLFALDFEPGGVWETDDGAIKPLPGQAFHLKEGRGRMRYGRDCIELRLAALKSGERRLRDAPPASDAVRVLIAFETPADESMLLRTYQENTARWR